MARLESIVGKAISGEWGEDDENGTGIPVLRTTNFTNDGVINYTNVVTRIITKDDLSVKYLRPGDIIIEKSGGSGKQPVGRVVYYDGPDNTYLFNNFTGVLRIIDTDQWDSKYLFYALFANYQRGGTRKYQNKTTGLHNLKTDQYVKEVEIPERLYNEQKHIAHILDKVCNLIALQKQQLDKLDELVKARFVEMFGEPETNTKGWPISNIGNLCSVGSSKRIYQSEQSSAGIPFWRVSDLTNLINTGVATENLYIPEKRYAELQAQGQVPVKGDILITSRGTLGQCYIVKATDRFYFQDGMISWLSEYADSITPFYISHLFSMPGFRKQIDSMQAGSTVAYLSIAMIKKLKVMIPDAGTQQQFAAFVEQIDQCRLTIQLGLDKLEMMKKALMQEYFG